MSSAGLGNICQETIVKLQPSVCHPLWDSEILVLRQKEAIFFFFFFGNFNLFNINSLEIKIIIPEL